MNKTLNKKNISKYLINEVGNQFVNNRDNINEKLDNILNEKFGKFNFDEDRYEIDLKKNITYLKSSIKNNEKLLIKWVVDKKIPNKDEFKIINKKLNEVNKKFVDEVDLNTFIKHKGMEVSKEKILLPKNYKYLYIYNDILSIILRKIVLNDEIYNEILSEEPKELLKTIKTEIRKYAILILNSNDEKCIDKHTENKGKDNYIDKVECKHENEYEDEINYDQGYENDKEYNIFKSKKFKRWIMISIVCAFLGGIIYVELTTSKEKNSSARVYTKDDQNQDIDKTKYVI